MSGGRLSLALLAKSIADDLLVSNFVFNLFLNFLVQLGFLEIDEASIVVERPAFVDRVVLLDEDCDVFNTAQLVVWVTALASISHPTEHVLLLQRFL